MSRVIHILRSMYININININIYSVRLKNIVTVRGANVSEVRVVRAKGIDETRTRTSTKE